MVKIDPNRSKVQFFSTIFCSPTGFNLFKQWSTLIYWSNGVQSFGINISQIKNLCLSKVQVFLNCMSLLRMDLVSIRLLCYLSSGFHYPDYLEMKRSYLKFLAS